MIKFLSASLILLCTFSLIIACGSSGGGGDGSSVNTDTGISYSGSTLQAILTETNSQEILTGAYLGGNTSAAVASLGVVQETGKNTITRPRTLTVYEALENALLDIDIPSSSGGLSSGVAANEKGRLNGDCGGNAEYDINADNLTGIFSGSLTFNSYCASNTTLSGTTNFSGQINVNTRQAINFNFSFKNLSGSYGSDSVTLRGDIVCDFSSSNPTVTMTMLMRDNPSGKVYKVENYVMNMTLGASYVDVVASGRYYDPVQGYVDISTPAAIRIYDSDSWPSQGTLFCSGDSNTRAQLIVVSSSQYRILTDADGNGVYEYDSGDLNWNDL